MPFIKIMLAALCGGLIGLERQLSGKAAGMRTNILIAVGSAMFTILSLEIAKDVSGNFIVDPSRLAANVVVGIGFIGAGTIMQSRKSVHGLTTAATMWVVASLGVGIGLGMYAFIMLSTLFILFILTMLIKVERFFEFVLIPASRILIHARYSPTVCIDVKKVFTRAGSPISKWKTRRKGNRITIWVVHHERPGAWDKIHGKLLQMPDILNVRRAD